MQVEVNDANITQFGLVELTGNTRELLMTRAREAEESGYVLSVEIPDTLIHMNVFDMAPSSPSEAETDRRNPIMDPEPDKAAPGRDVHVEVVLGEVIDSRED